MYKCVSFLKKLLIRILNILRIISFCPVEWNIILKPSPFCSFLPPVCGIKNDFFYYMGQSKSLTQLIFPLKKYLKKLSFEDFNQPSFWDDGIAVYEFVCPMQEKRCRPITHQQSCHHSFSQPSICCPYQMLSDCPSAGWSRFCNLQSPLWGGRARCPADQFAGSDRNQPVVAPKSTNSTMVKAKALIWAT